MSSYYKYSENAELSYLTIHVTHLDHLHSNQLNTTRDCEEELLYLRVPDAMSCPFFQCKIALTPFVTGLAACQCSLQFLTEFFDFFILFTDIFLS